MTRRHLKFTRPPNEFPILGIRRDKRIYWDPKESLRHRRLRRIPRGEDMVRIVEPQEATLERYPNSVNVEVSVAGFLEQGTRRYFTRLDSRGDERFPYDEHIDGGSDMVVDGTLRGWWSRRDENIREMIAAVKMMPSVEGENPDNYSKVYNQFAPGSYFVKNNLTYDSLQALESQYASLNPEYNYYVKAYEEAIAVNYMPEAALPNMYIYDFLSGLDAGSPISRTWQDPDRAQQELVDGYDRLIRLGEVTKSTIPLLRFDAEIAPIKAWLRNYGERVQQSAIVLDTNMTSDLAREYYHMYTPSSRMSFYDQINHKKHQFPMYIENEIPTFPTGIISQLIETIHCSTSAINSLVISPREPFIFAAISDAFIDPLPRAQANPHADDELWSQPTSGLMPLQLSKVHMSSALNVFSLEQWLSTMEGEVVGTPVLPPENDDERLPRRCVEPVDRITMQILRNRISDLEQVHFLTYRELVESETIHYCPHETIVYKLKKIDVSGEESKEVQQFYFPNTSKEDMIKFVDTQVKYDKLYRYEVYGYAVVFGSRYVFRRVELDLGGEAFTQTAEARAKHYIRAPYAVVNVQSFPKTEIIEYPIYTNDWATAARLATGVLPAVVAGCSLQDVKILDRPPVPPEIQIYPYRNNPREILLMMGNGMGSFLREYSVPFIALDPEELVQKTDLGRYQQKFEYYPLRSPRLEFKSDGSAEVKKIQLFRTTSPLSSRTYPDNESIYGAFGGEPYRILDISEPGVESFDFVDTLEPNTQYYYTARSIDAHGWESNPSMIFQVELVNDSGIYFPLITPFFPKIVEPGAFSKKMIRFLEIGPADLQTMVSNEFDEVGRNISTKGFIPNVENKVQNNHFVVRLTSRDTGRKVDFKIVFKEKEDLALDDEET